MSLMPWKPPLNTPPLPTPSPSGGGFLSWFRHAMKLTRVTFVGMFVTFLGFALVPLIIKVMGGLGIAFVSYQLGSMALTEVFQVIKNNFDALPPEVIPFVGMAKIGEGISIIFGGMAARLALMGFTSSTSTGKRRGMIWEA